MRTFQQVQNLFRRDSSRGESNVSSGGVDRIVSKWRGIGGPGFWYPLLAWAILPVFLVLRAAAPAPAGRGAVTSLSLPPLRIEGQAATAHTQGVEVIGDDFYVTARREDVHPSRALLLRTNPRRTDWDVWDITPRGTGGESSVLDHPGGFQSDGRRLWIPVAESRRNGRSVVRTYALADLRSGAPVKPEREFPVDDHIGALAVSARHKVLLGANWDTETVYVWDLAGHLQRTLRGDALKSRGLGAVAGPEGRVGLAIQDWKWRGEFLYAGGLFKAPGQNVAPPLSRWWRFSHFLEPEFTVQSLALPMILPVEVAHEAMAITGRAGFFLPEDLGTTNRVFRVPLSPRT